MGFLIFKPSPEMIVCESSADAKGLCCYFFGFLKSPLLVSCLAVSSASRNSNLCAGVWLPWLRLGRQRGLRGRPPWRRRC
jgi:hypothetical protein